MSVNQPSGNIDYQALQQAAQKVRQRIQTDPSFTAQLVSDPRGTLEAAGIPSDAVNSVIGYQTDPQTGQDCFLSSGLGGGCLISCATTSCCLTISVCCGTKAC